MSISEVQLSSIETSLTALLASGTSPLSELRSQFPQLTFVRCAPDDMEGDPYRRGDGYQLHLIERQGVCISVTDNPEQADGVVVAL